MQFEFDDDREWVTFWVEDEEWRQDLEQIWRESVPGYRPYQHPRGVIELEISGE